MVSSSFRYAHPLSGKRTINRSLPQIVGVILILLTVIAGQARGNPPHLTLSAGALRLKIALPDAKDGYYRSSRFDWSGLIYDARWGGIPLFGEFREPRDPKKPDNIGGTAEEFDIGGPTTFEAKENDFLKIGVGILRKDPEDHYANETPYELVDGGEWKVTQGKNWAEFRHRAGPLRGVAYELTKRIVLGAQPGSFRIERTLRNTGSRDLNTEHYGHHFFRIAGDPVGLNYQIVLPENCPLERMGGTVSPIRVMRGCCSFRRDLEKDEYFQFSVLYEGSGNFSITNTKVGLDVEVTSSALAKRLVLFATDRTLSPEIFTDIRLTPGQAFSWSTQYQVRQQIPIGHQGQKEEENGDFSCSNGKCSIFR